MSRRFPGEFFWYFFCGRVCGVLLGVLRKTSVLVWSFCGEFVVVRVVNVVVKRTYLSW